MPKNSAARSAIFKIYAPCVPAKSVWAFTFINICPYVAYIYIYQLIYAWRQYRAFSSKCSTYRLSVSSCTITFRAKYHRVSPYNPDVHICYTMSTTLIWYITVPYNLLRYRSVWARAINVDVCLLLSFEGGKFSCCLVHWDIRYTLLTCAMRPNLLGFHPLVHVPHFPYIYRNNFDNRRDFKCVFLSQSLIKTLS